MERSSSHESLSSSSRLLHSSKLSGDLPPSQEYLEISSGLTQEANKGNLESHSLPTEEEKRIQEMDVRMSAMQRELMILRRQVDYLTHYDHLTGLPSRYRFDQDISTSLCGDNERLPLVVLVLNLDGFQNINHTKGHDIGNLFLQEIASRLRSVILEPNKLYHLGADEFAVVASAMDSEARIQSLSNSILLACQQVADIQEYELQISVSVGISRFPQDWDHKSTLDKSSQIKKAAGIALFHAKRSGKNKTVFFKASMNAQAEAAVASQNQIKLGIEREEFIPFFQPQYTIDHQLNSAAEAQEKPWTDDNIVGFEILARWRPTGTDEVLSPNRFLDIAEKLNLVSEIDLIVVKKLFELLQAHPHVLAHVEHISLNFSAETFANEKHVYKTIDLLETYHIPADKIVIELTEHTFFKGTESTIANMNLMRSLGFRFALDDFGTGYSALHCLNLLPLDFLKIDQAFVRPMETDDFYRVMIAHIVSLARDLNLELIAEGLESGEQVLYLQSLGVEVFQGYFFSKPLNTQQYLQLVHEW